jgi:hypothetical protein
MGKRRDAYSVFVWKPDQLEDPGVERRIILKRIYRSRMAAWTESIWLRIGTGRGLL